MPRLTPDDLARYRADYHQCGVTVMPLVAEIEALLAERDEARQTAREHEAQLVNLSAWCRQKLGVDTNAVIGRDGWPNTVTEVVIKAAEAVPAERDRLAAAVREAAQACKQAQDDKQWEALFKEFLVYLEGWGEEHSDRVDSVFVNVGDGALNILVCTTSPSYDFDLDDTITELDLALVKRFTWLVAEVMQVPGSVQGDRIPYEKAILVYGDGTRAPTPGGA